MRTKTKIAKDHAQKALNTIVAKYTSNEDDLDCTRMSDDDYKIYHEIDRAIVYLKDILSDESK